MRTTLGLPDDLFRRLKAKAAMDGAKLKDLVARYIEVGLRQSSPSTRLRRSRLPIIKSSNRVVIPELTPELQARSVGGS